MANVTWRISKRKTRSRRAANNKLKNVNATDCPNCHEKKLPHRICPNCGHYDGKERIAKD
ncbi:MAG: 50S ribosomal protein L32 [bacterium]